MSFKNIQIVTIKHFFDHIVCHFIDHLTMLTTSVIQLSAAQNMEYSEFFEHTPSSN